MYKFLRARGRTTICAESKPYLVLSGSAARFGKQAATMPRFCAVRLPVPVGYCRRMAIIPTDRRKPPYRMADRLDNRFSARGDAARGLKRFVAANDGNVLDFPAPVLVAAEDSQAQLAARCLMIFRFRSGRW